MKKAFFTWGLIFLFIAQFKSQFAIYTFTQMAGTYSPITGGTVYGSQTTDDEVFINTAAPFGNAIGTSGTGLPIGFNFFINGNIYDRIGISANGFIFLGQTTSTPAIVTQISNQFAPISSTTIANSNLQHKVSAFGLDIQSQNNFGEIRMQTIGTSPNQTMVVQWTSYRKYNNTGDDYNFQIRLCQTTNVIEVIYGTFVNNGTNGIAQVGLRGSMVSDYSNRYVNAINVWASSAAGTSNTTTANFNSSLIPSSGQIYRWLPPPPCTTTPSGNTTQASLSNICPGGSSTLSLANTYSLSGITYNWMASTTSSTGPFNNISGAGANFYNASNIASSTWYQCAIACSNGGNTIFSAPKLVSTAGSIISNVPYTEDFENILVNNQLPNCSWASTSPTTICQTYTSPSTFNRVGHSGSKFASFQNGNYPNGHSFFTNGIQLYAGVTYSASVWYITDGLNGWAEFSLLRGAAQSTANLTSIATVTSIYTNITNFVYAPLSNTFTVPNSGVYYLAAKCRSNNTGQYFTFDDISVTIPCSLNQPSVNISASSSTVCLGNTVTLTASGANSYSWSSGPSNPVFTLSPGTNGVYSVTGSNTLTGCASTQTQAVTVLPTPILGILSGSLSVCSGNTVYLAALGADTYQWSNGATSSLVVVSPTLSTTYSVVGSNTSGCSSTASAQILVLPNPTVTAAVNPTQICVGEAATLSATGATSYTWIANTNLLTGNNIQLNPNASFTYTVSGKSANNCVSAQTVALVVQACTGLVSGAIESNAIRVYPNPCHKVLMIDSGSQAPIEIEIKDLLGRTLISEKNSLGVTIVNVENLLPGVYFISTNGFRAQRFVKSE
ncbi:MAG: T9SS type A sorting domain-containing protein [Bacteroidia bacterium]|nr:T9SS type A sorting domain-containing protein [Bacteroidia bacterium]